MLSIATDGFYCPPTGTGPGPNPGPLIVPRILEGEENPAELPLPPPSVVATGGSGGPSIISGEDGPPPGIPAPRITDSAGAQVPSIVQGEAQPSPLVPRIIDGSES